MKLQQECSLSWKVPKKLNKRRRTNNLRSKRRKTTLDQQLHNITNETVEIERELEMSVAQMETNVQAYNNLFVQMNNVHSHLERIKAENESQS